MTKPIFPAATGRLVACVAVCVAVGIALAVGGAAAQGEIDVSPSNESTTEYVQEIDEDVRLVSWEYDDTREGFEIVIESDRRTTITMTEAVQFSEGAGSGRYYDQRLPAGTSEVFVSVEKRGGQAALTMVTPGSAEDGRFVWVSTGETSPDRPPVTYERVQLIVILTALGASGMAFGIVAKRREEEDRDWERIL